ncbi:ankyrin repeat protein [Novosphingobium kunmingense]|uniref:Ankyrin repeat protein n=1 Tax=Novosphingobium kunmingense TaxID=1211806 RepID=A0A2N0H6I6_9SPHN|nr:ankyrin repeat domain-containing protein [Novosphingobium kunmingense]PKB14561.1 ankyrin repeat protein [Novosphingobium kunmingense]
MLHRLVRFAALPVLSAGLFLAAPAAAQMSDSYKFLDAVKKKEGNEVTDALEKGSPNLVNTRDVTTGETALHLVTQRRDLTWMQYLIGKGANVNVRDARGQTPLVVASNFSFVEGVELLVARGARVDESNNAGETPLITAVHNRNLALVRVLLKANASPTRADNSGRSALDYAAIDGKNGTIHAELEAASKVKAATGAKPAYGPNF